MRAKKGIVESTEWTYRRKNGSKLPVNLTVTTLRNEGEEITGYLLVAYDITEQKRAKDYIQHIAHHDEMTGLPNRSLMQDRLENATLRVKRHGGNIAVLVLDLDRFKRINDSLGHMAGDQLLKTVAERLKMCVRESDTVCRMGGDEFVVLLPDINSERDVERVCQKILELIANPVQIGLNSLTVTPSIGVSIAPQHGMVAEKLLTHADLAMYQAKQNGRNSYQIYEPAMAKASVETLAIEQMLHQAFTRRQLRVFYQPQVDMHSQSVSGFEALLRWPHPDKGMISPSTFIPLIEATGFIVPLGEWVIQQACRDIQLLRLRNKTDYQLAVNVSPQQFEQHHFVDAVKHALRTSGMPPDALEIEITEGLLVGDTELTLGKLNQLTEMGVKLAIDDFGTGYSNLAYVSRYPITTIKIDRAFLDLSDPANQAIVSAITAIGHGLEIELVAEGVETNEQLTFATGKGCRLIQGFFFSEAVAIEQMGATLRKIHGKLTYAKASAQQG